MSLRQRIRSLFRSNKRKRQDSVDNSGDDGGNAQEKGNEQEEAKKESNVEILPEPLKESELPTFFHVGLLAKMCLVHGYTNGPWKLQCTSKTEDNFFMSTFGEGYPTWNSVYGGLEIYKEQGNFHGSLAWLTDGFFLSDVGANGKNLGGMWSSVLKSMITTSDGFKYQCKVKCGFERSPVKMEFYIPIYKEPLFMGYILVEPAKSYVLGYRTVFNVEDKKFDMHSLCVGCIKDSIEVGMKLENFETVRGSIFQRIGSKWALALKANLYGNVNAKLITIGGQYEWEPGTLLKAKLRGDTRLGFIFQRKLREDIEFLFHFGFQGKDPINGKHKVGMSWYFNV
ncbi:voltage-dependent anion-selective channel [Drosophila eugracilis]|uniref:voltage-dependent anion-selective channel n=1 Tax=Drosophila eugracilis TaxID=29029 RepID=UPI001BDADA12|nr:voltage-dependent anion-selective channel [Drosophila eugracilis]